ncbi:MAG TPA: hypothetical protein VL306_01140 [Methylomirabilota bacterium]|nr:hypothetical protein [Methylomirabilota bacterium]
MYQPAEQQPDILQAIVDQSYRPILEGLLKNPKVRLTLNINGALLELFEKYDHKDLIDTLRKLSAEQRIEFTSSAKYHALLPFLNEQEIIRQITLNNESLKSFLGKDVKLQGFFAPEMAFDEKLPPIIERLGFKWMILDEISCGGEVGQVDYTKIYNIAGTKLNVFFRDRRLSNLIMSAVVRSRQTLLEAMQENMKNGSYIITAMDAETFGHHRPGLEKMLFEVFDTPEFELVQISDLDKFYKETKTIVPAKATWASSKQDIDNGSQFLSWSDPENIIHKWQWAFTQLVLNEVYRMDQKHPRYELVRHKMDIALASDHFWWASAKPWWSLEMIEDGAFRLLDTLRHIPEVSEKDLELARDYYEKIITTAFNWQRTGKIRQMMMSQNSILRIPFKDRTVGKGGAEEGVFWAFMDMMKKLEEKAVQNREYEKAILWRDAMFKLENKLDIYDTINAIDLLRVEIPHKEVEETIEKYKSKYYKIRGGQPEQRGS